MSLEKRTTDEQRVAEAAPLLERSVPSKTPLRQYLWIPLLFLALGFDLSHFYHDWIAPRLAQSGQNGGPDFSYLASHCAHIPPISSDSFISRQDSLARTLHSLNAAAYIAEPSASAGFFANLSRSHWGLSERPLLLIIQPQTDDGGIVRANVSILAPAFEKTRARMLPIPSDAGVTYTAWPEDVNPYSTALALVPDLDGAVLYVDGDVRTFVTDGLQKAAPGAKVLNAPIEIKRLRERKSSEELDIMKCVNEVTVLAIRAVRKHITIGVRESDVKQLMQSALSAAGLTDAFSLVLFGENAALPHGAGTDRVLGKHDFILIDTGGALHGYHSDTTRTFALDSSVIPLRYQALWHSVHSAQRHAMLVAKNGTITAAVDHAARKIIKDAGYGEFFTHRLGHGIGLEVHESPYLRGGSDDVILSGHTFSNEPGIYIEEKIGVRLEDCFYIDEDGLAKFLTEGVGGQASSPWSP